MGGSGSKALVEAPGQGAQKAGVSSSYSPLKSVCPVGAGMPDGGVGASQSIAVAVGT